MQDMKKRVLESLDLRKYLPGTASKDKWKRLGVNRSAGVLVPLFSVFSKRSCGVGDFEDLKLVIDWCKKTGNSILQLLPMNECGSTFCPYDSVSAFALEPMYICLDKLSEFHSKKDKSRLEELRKKYPMPRERLNYGIKEEKLKFLRKIYAAGTEDDVSRLKEFREENSYWINDFALFKVLKYHQAGRAWYDWEEEYRNYKSDILEDFKNKHAKEINFQIWLQWQLYKQFKEVKKYAKANKILIKGDLPILVSRDSADVWTNPQLFKLEFAAGAPPDMYCAKGQRWGMPTYNWDNIVASGYDYLKDKLKYAENFYDMLRIDHVVGLFRIWSIPYNEPLENKGLNGFFDPPDEDRWAEYGQKILSVIIENTKMLLCAEDLGIIPEVCPMTLNNLGIPGNDVQRWTKDWHLKHDFLPPGGYRLLSVTMLSTHDTTNWPAWWEYEAGTIDEALFIRKCSGRLDYSYIKDKLFDAGFSRYGRLRWKNNIGSADELAGIMEKRKEEIADFIDLYENSFQEKEKLWKCLGLNGPMREKQDAEIVRAVIKQNLESNAIFSINTIVDWLYISGVFKGDTYRYRINTPGTVSADNWSLVIPLPLEDLLKDKLNNEIKKMITASGRV